MIKKEMIAMLLAGGQGSRLGVHIPIQIPGDPDADMGVQPERLDKFFEQIIFHFAKTYAIMLLKPVLDCRGVRR